jgi:uncharacterized protein YndB with AHSA1/START domain
MTVANGPSATADREIVVTRTIEGPRALVFEAYTDPRHLAQWWGPVALVERGGTTEVTRRALFQTKEQRDEVVERYHAIEGGKQTLGRLAAYVATLTRKEG